MLARLSRIRLIPVARVLVLATSMMVVAVVMLLLSPQTAEAGQSVVLDTYLDASEPWVVVTLEAGHTYDFGCADTAMFFMGSEPNYEQLNQYYKETSGLRKSWRVTVPWTCEYWVEWDSTTSNYYRVWITEPVPPVIRVAGTDRYATAVNASRLAFPTGAQSVVIASGTNWPDALGGGALAGALGAPVLLVKPTSLPSVVADEIERLGATKAIIVGGTAAVSQSTKNAIDALPGMTTERIGGVDRYETAKKIAERTKLELGAGYDGTVFLSTGANYPDALAASPLAAGKGWPILLTKATALPDYTKQALQNLDASTLLILGGTGVVSNGVEASAEGIVGSPATRLAGLNRFDTAARIATYGVDNAGLTWDGLAFATGNKFPDALAGGCAQGKKGSVMLLTQSATLPAESRAVLTNHRAEIHEVWFFGGTPAISDGVRDQVLSILQ